MDNQLRFSSMYCHDILLIIGGHFLIQTLFSHTSTNATPLASLVGMRAKNQCGLTTRAIFACVPYYMHVQAIMNACRAHIPVSSPWQDPRRFRSPGQSLEPPRPVSL